ncbi:MAG: tetratricopeptide repeat protein [Candidatus Omnitrophica bacterium]|nr:tetratricopeptide repeat protein [Candidatus Omnitrophota bacterium]
MQNRPFRVTVLVLLSWFGLAGIARADELYHLVQSAFLSEHFDRVVELTGPLLKAPNPLPSVGDLTKPARLWLWYILSLDRLQRSTDALEQIDRMKEALGALPRESAAQQALLDSLWPELLFWEGEISRTSLNLVRAKLAYQRVITDYEHSSWRLRAQLGLGLVLFQHQDYDQAQAQFQRVAFGATAGALAGESRLLEGLCQLRTKRFIDAAVLFKRLVEQSADSASRSRAWFYLGEAHTGLRRFEEAVGAYEQAIASEPNSRWATLGQFGRGWSEFQLHRCPESLEAMRKYLESTPSIAADVTQNNGESPVEALFAQGRCLAELGDERMALARFEELRRLDPEHALAVEAAFSMAEIYERQQQHARASELLQEIRQEAFDPGQVSQANVRLGNVALAQGDVAAALSYFQAGRAATDPAVQQAAFNGIADSQVRLGQRKEAAGSYEEAIRLSPTAQGGLYGMYGLGRLKLQAGELDEAIELFRRLVATADAPASGAEDRRRLIAEGELALSFAYLSKGQKELARVQLERLTGEQPGTVQAARAGYYRALLAVDEGDLKTARRLCEEVLVQASASTEAFEARLLLADVVTGEASVTDAIELAGRNADHLSGQQRGRLGKKLGDLARQAGAHAEALRWYESAWENLPDQRGEIVYLVASCFEAGGDAALALSRYRAIREPPWSIRGRLSAAKLLEREGRLAEAIAMYTEVARERVPEAKVAQERLGVLSRPPEPRGSARPPWLRDRR